MKRLARQAAMMCLDWFLVNIALYLAFWLRFEGSIPSRYIDLWAQYSWVLAFLAVAVFFLFGMYNNMWKYASVYELGQIFLSVTAYSVLVWVVFLLAPARLPRSVHILFWMLLMAFA